MGKNKGLGMVSALAVGAGVAALAAGKKYKTAEAKKKEEYDALHNTSEYRNTERGKYEKNSKGIYYTCPVSYTHLDVYKRQIVNMCVV